MSKNYKSSTIELLLFALVILNFIWVAMKLLTADDPVIPQFE